MKKKLIIEFKTLPAAIRTNQFSLFQALLLAVLIAVAAALVVQISPNHQ